MTKQRDPWSPTDYMGFGLLALFIFAVVGLVVAFVGLADWGVLVVAVGGAIGGFLFLVGMIAHAVTVGIRHSRE